MGTYKTVLAGTDGSDSSFRAVHRAAGIAKDEQANLVIVCAYSPENIAVIDEAQDAIGEDSFQVVGSNPAEQTLSMAVDRARNQGLAGRVVKTNAVRGTAADVLIEESDRSNAGLLVVGNRGLNTLQGRILGSVPNDVARRARCDVLIVYTTV